MDLLIPQSLKKIIFTKKRYRVRSDKWWV